MTKETTFNDLIEGNGLKTCLKVNGAKLCLTSNDPASSNSVLINNSEDGNGLKIGSKKIEIGKELELGSGSDFTLKKGDLTLTDGDLTLSNGSMKFEAASGSNKIELKDNLSDALNITEASNSYMKFVTSDSGEKIHIGKPLELDGTSAKIEFGGATSTNKIELTDNLADALNITEGDNSYMKFVTTNGAGKIHIGKPLELDGGNAKLEFGGASTKNKIELTDNLADALNITEGSNSYMKFVTTNSGEKIHIGKPLELDGTSAKIEFGGATGTNQIKLTDSLADALNITDGTNSFLKFNTTAEEIVAGKTFEISSGNLFHNDAGGKIGFFGATPVTKTDNTLAKLGSFNSTVTPQSFSDGDGNTITGYAQASAIETAIEAAHANLLTQLNALQDKLHTSGVLFHT